MDKKVSIKVVLVEPMIPPNTGNIARLCASNNLELYLVGKLGFSLDDKHLKRAGLDYWEHVKLFILHSFDDFVLDQKTKTGFEPRCFFFTKKAKKSIFEHKFIDGDVLVFGPEDKGFSDEFLAVHTANLIRIPMQSENVRSLNLSSAVAVAVYEAMRQIG